MSAKTIAERAIEQGKGIVRLTPTWVPRVFCIPGRRIKLHPDDYYALGANRGGIDERWFGSTTPADNGPLTSENEGLSHIVVTDGGSMETVLLRDAVDELKDALIGKLCFCFIGEYDLIGLSDETDPLFGLFFPLFFRWCFCALHLLLNALHFFLFLDLF